MAPYGEARWVEFYDYGALEVMGGCIGKAYQVGPNYLFVTPFIGFLTLLTTYNW